MTKTYRKSGALLQTFTEKWLFAYPAYKDSARFGTVLKQIFRQFPPPTSVITPLPARFSAKSGPSSQQLTALTILILTLGGLGVWSLPNLLNALYWVCWACFMGNALVRLAACAISTKPRPYAIASPSVENLPTYSVIVALYKEAEIVPQLLKAMLALDYPRDRLEILFALEADDHETLSAFRAQNLPAFLRIVEVPPGFPRTKPRALNHALEQATGDLIVIYDAEDQPHPGQLRDAAMTFAKGDPKLACLQAPLRPTFGKGFIARHFAIEYAVQFDILLPALHTLRLPFPLGGTSNHFRADVLRSIGGWDAFNVTEDADLGLRLAQLGYMSGMISSPTGETPPMESRAWVPQRTRWLKGYMQTFLVHTRLNTSFKPQAWLGLFFGVALSVMAALCYAPFSFAILTSLLLTAVQAAHSPDHPLHIVAIRDLSLFVMGTLSGMISQVFATRRAGLRITWLDVLCAPAYWCLQSVAAAFALHQLVVKPFHWDKTEHHPIATEPAVFAVSPLYETGACAYGLEHDHKRHAYHSAHQGLG